MIRARDEGQKTPPPPVGTPRRGNNLDPPPPVLIPPGVPVSAENGTVTRYAEPSRVTTSNVTRYVPSSEEIEAALQRCRDTIGPEVPCRLPEYLEARKRYHALLLLAGIPVPGGRRVYETDAARQKAYRDRKRTEAFVGCAVPCHPDHLVGLDG